MSPKNVKQEFLSKIKNYILQYNMIENNDSLILGVSGGADSVCLLCIIHNFIKEYNLRVKVIHVNHGIRGEEALRDEKFVENLCIKLNVEYEAVHRNIPDMAKKEKLSEEEAGRIARYEIFNNAIENEGFKKIVIAHNSNDSVETTLHNMIRGSRLKGICPILPKSNNIIRPLLIVTRKEIEEYLASINQTYINDSTNEITDYTRNKIRLKLIPYMEEEINNQACKHILDLSLQMEEAYNYLEKAAIKEYNKNIYLKDNIIMFKADKIKEIDEPVKSMVIRIAIKNTCNKLKDITGTHVTSIIKLLDNNSGKSINLPYNIKVWREFEYLCFKQNENVLNKTFTNNGDFIKQIVLKNQKQNIRLLNNNSIEATILNMEELDNNFLKERITNEENVYTKYLDCDRIENTLVIRKRKPGDFLIINKDGGKKKLKQYFVDEKIPSRLRDDIYLLADGSHIIWIIGYRISEKYKVTSNTNRILKIKYINEV